MDYERSPDLFIRNPVPMKLEQQRFHWKPALYKSQGKLLCCLRYLKRRKDLQQILAQTFFVLRLDQNSWCSEQSCPNFLLFSSHNCGGRDRIPSRLGRTPYGGEIDLWTPFSIFIVRCFWKSWTYFKKFLDTFLHGKKFESCQKDKQIWLVGYWPTLTIRYYVAELPLSTERDLSENQYMLKKDVLRENLTIL